MRYLAIDLGDKRTGLAVGDPRSGIISPITVLTVPVHADDGRQLIAALTREIDRNVAPTDTLVMGLPYNMDGTEGPRARIVRAFGERLAEHTRRPIVYHDERLTSVHAEWKLNQSGLTRDQKKRRRDALAAAALLESLFDQLANPTPVVGQAPDREPTDTPTSEPTSAPSPSQPNGSNP